MTYGAIGDALGVSLNRAWQIVRQAQRRAKIARVAAAAAKACVLALGLSFIAGGARADPCKAIPDFLAPGSEFSGPVTYVGDGDSLCLALGPSPEQWVEVRLADFYAPELHEPGGEAAKAALEAIALGQLAACVAQLQSYDRVVARCRVGGRSLGDQMRASGVPEGGRGR